MTPPNARPGCDIVERLRSDADNVGHSDRSVYPVAPMLDAATEIERLRAALAERAGWRPIETAPRDGTRLLLWCADAVPDEGPSEADVCAVGHWDAEEIFWDRETRRHTTGRWLGKPDTYYAIYLTPTHWMPLPAPPEVAT